ncbi:TolC family outer membrane protein [Sphingomonas sp.]|uniref:TolC family outer membrane protein n=1 Tax=Sphingomonas sp. TaxID=28214 RepID=UPI0035A851C0
MTRLFCSVAVIALAATPATAETLRDALVKAYETNPTLAAQRATLRANDENVPITRAPSLPQVQVQSTYSENVVLPITAFTAPSRTSQTQASLTYSLFAGGAVKNGVAAAKSRVEGGRATLRGTEADLFTAVVAAYVDVQRDSAVVQLNEQNVRVLDVNLQASRDRFQVGDLTRTDVAQSEARLALAQSQLETAQSRLIASRENYIRLVGSTPGELDTPPPLPKLPGTPDEAVKVALAENPTLLAARKALEASGFDVKSARATRLPTVDAFAQGNYTNFLGTLGGFPGNPAPPQFDRTAQFGVRLSLPIYQGGAPAARIRQAQARQSASIEQLTEAERSVVSQTRSVYASYRAALDVIRSAEAAVSANRLALEGVKAENSVGNRTILEILNAEQELLNAQVTLVTARRDAYVAGFAVLAAMGRAEAKDLGLENGPLYDPVANYDRVRNRIFDWDQDPTPKPVATSTTGTPAQTAIVAGRIDPSLSNDARPTPVDKSPVNPAPVAPKR